MVRVVNLDNQIGDGELELVRPKPSFFVAGRQIQARAEIEQDIRRLRDDELAGFEERRRKRRPRAALVVDDFHHRRHAGFAFAARDIDVICAGFFQRQPNKLAASLDGRMVVKLVAHTLGSERFQKVSSRPRWQSGIVKKRNLGPVVQPDQGPDETKGAVSVVLILCRR
jgi:hypothetical protein